MAFITAKYKEKLYMDPVMIEKEKMDKGIPSLSLAFSTSISFFLRQLMYSLFFLPSFLLPSIIPSNRKIENERALPSITAGRFLLSYCSTGDS